MKTIMNRRQLITIILALAAVCSTWAQQQPTFRLSGSVVDSFTGEAVDSCLVEVWNASVRSLSLSCCHTPKACDSLSPIFL